MTLSCKNSCGSCWRRNINNSWPDSPDHLWMCTLIVISFLSLPRLWHLAWRDPGVHPVAVPQTLPKSEKHILKVVLCVIWFPPSPAIWPQICLLWVGSNSPRLVSVSPICPIDMLVSSRGDLGILETTSPGVSFPISQCHDRGAQEGCWATWGQWPGRLDS